MADKEIENKVNHILQQLTLEEKIELLGGEDHYFTHGITRLGLPKMRMADGPMGVRNFGPSTGMPGGIALASTWNTELAEQMGKEIALDARAKGVHFLLAPGVNMYRSPLNGRNFEYFGEDPFLASRLAVAFINGVQKQGVSATVKHFIANDSEFDRHHVDPIIDERTLREIYLPPFEASVKESKVGAIMDAYNLINDFHATQNNHLNNEIAKREWGFDGIIMSDWIATYDTAEAAIGGLDLEMPSGKFLNKEKLIPLIKEGKLAESVIDDKVRRLLRLAVRFEWLQREQLDLSLPAINLEGKQIALQTAREGIVLLKNEHHLLPLNLDTIKTVAVIGPNAFPAVPVGGGSSRVQPFSAVSFLEGITEFAGDKEKVLSSRGIPALEDLAEDTLFTTTTSGTETGLKAEYFNNEELAGPPFITRVDQHVLFGSGADLIWPEGTLSSRWTGYFKPSAPGVYEFFVQTMNEPHGFYRLYVDDQLILDHWTMSKALVDFKTVNLDARPHKIVFEQTNHSTVPTSRLRLGIIKSDAFVEDKALKIASIADIVILAVGFDPHSESEGSDRTFRLPPGQEELIQKISGINKNVVVVITSGGNVDMNSWVDQVPAIIQAWYPGEQGGVALAEILFGKVNPSGKLPVTFEKKWEDNPTYHSYYPEKNTKQVPYKEGLFVGYRGFEKNRVKPRFPFGFGLSYTSFSYSDLIATPHEATFTIKNTGQKEGKEIAQLYISEVNPKIERPFKELKGFVKVSLSPGESKTVSIPLNDRSFAFYDSESKQWKVNPGKYRVMVGSSSDQINLEMIIER